MPRDVIIVSIALYTTFTVFILFSRVVSDMSTQLMDVKTVIMIKVHNICELNEGVCLLGWLGWYPPSLQRFVASINGRPDIQL